MGKSAKKDKSDREKSNKGDKVKEKKDKKSLKKMKSMKSVENNNKEEEPKSLASLFETDGVKVDSTIDSLFSQPVSLISMNVILRIHADLLFRLALPLFLSEREQKLSSRKRMY